MARVWGSRGWKGSEGFRVLGFRALGFIGFMGLRF